MYTSEAHANCHTCSINKDGCVVGLKVYYVIKMIIGLRSAMQKCIGRIFSSENSLEVFMDIFMCRIIKKCAYRHNIERRADESNRILCLRCVWVQLSGSKNNVYSYCSPLSIIHKCTFSRIDGIGKDLTVIDFHLFFFYKKLFYHKSGSYLILILPIK